MFCIRKGGQNVGREISLTDGNVSSVSNQLEAVNVLANSKREERVLQITGSFSCCLLCKCQ